MTDVGALNADFVLNFMRIEGIRVVAQDLRDIYPRKVYYFPKTGKVLVKRLRSVHNDTLVNREREYISRLDFSRIEGEVELFE